MCNASGTNKSGWTSFKYFTTLSGSRITAGEAQLTQKLRIFPNPTRGIFNIVFVSDKLDDFEITIIDVFGKLRPYSYKLDPSCEGLMLFFPSYLQHFHQPFKESSVSRKSLACNFFPVGEFGTGNDSSLNTNWFK